MGLEGRHHLLFVDDDESEVKTFRRLYEGDQFEVTAVCVQFPRAAMPAVAQALEDRIPDLFVLDLFFPAMNDPPGGFTGATATAARADVRRVLQTTEELESLFLEDSILAQNDKKLLRAASNLTYQAQQLLRHWCDVLGQSPSGGIALMRLLHEKHLEVPTVFYSRKATVVDVKMALDAGALDVLLKPHESVEASEAVQIRAALRDYCAGKGPNWRKPLA